MRKRQPEAAQPSEAVHRLCARASQCGELYVFVAGRWVLGETETSRAASMRLLMRLGLSLLIAEESMTILPDGTQLGHHRPRPWEEE
ncbi:MAG: hypothetical protein M3506_04750 [Chloroflexota bacterium]|nr:hypothetical protein [Chloroflexota bacterium]